MAGQVFRAKNITKVYDRRTILDDVSIDINSGEIFGIIGASGSGKSTLLNILIGFIKPETGDVQFRVEHLLDNKESQVFRSVFKHPDDLKNNVGMASQVPSFYTTLSVKENLEYFGSLYNLPKETIKTNTTTLINLMDLHGSENRLAKNLSGGMQRRLDIACAVIHDPKLLILDEPTADLDPLLRNHIWRLVRKINKRGTTIILASHHLSELETLCTRIGIIKEGKMLTVGTPAEIKDKFSKFDEIHLETFPGHYDKISDIKSKDVLKEIIKIEDKGNKLLIQTSNSAIVLRELIKKLDEHNETIIDLKVTRPTLDEIFITMSESAQDRQDDLEEEKQIKSEKEKRQKKES